MGTRMRGSVVKFITGSGQVGPTPMMRMSDLSYVDSGTTISGTKTVPRNKHTDMADVQPGDTIEFDADVKDDGMLSINKPRNVVKV